MIGKFRRGTVQEDFTVLLRGLRKVQERGKEEWSVWDVMKAIELDPNTICLFGVDSEDFIIYQALQDNSVWVWCWYGTGNSFVDFGKAFIELLGQFGHTHLRFNSRRLGYIRMFKQIGIKPERVEYSIDLQKRNEKSK